MRRCATPTTLLRTAYPGDDGSRQPVHTVYVPADRYTPALPAEWGAAALAAAEPAGGLEALAERVGLPAHLRRRLAPRVRAKLEREPIEDLRLDFEDGYGDRGDDVEDADAVRAAAARGRGCGRRCRAAVHRHPIQVVSRRPRARAACGPSTCSSTTLVGRGGLPGRPRRSPCPRCRRSRRSRRWPTSPPRSSTPTACPTAGSASRCRSRPRSSCSAPTAPSPLAQLPLAAPGRISGLHYGTYDYSAALGIAARVPVAGASGRRPREGAHAARGGRHRHPPLRRIDQHPPDRRARRRSLAAARPPGAPLARARLSTRAGTCTRTSCPPGTSPPTRSTARAARMQRPGSATT